MLDMYRSDSQKSDSSQRPRVSFNRDVRIKKIGNSDAASIVEALAGDGEGHLVPTPVRREKIKASKRELALEADRVLKQADSVSSSLHSASPPRRQQRSKPDGGGSLRRKTSFGGTDSTKWNSEGKLSSYMSLDRPRNRVRKREPPTWEEQRHGGQQYRSSADLTSSAGPPKRRSTAGGRLTRSVSDAGDRDKPLAGGGKDAKRSISLFGTIERIKTKMKKRPTVEIGGGAAPRKTTTSAIERSAEPTVPPPSPPPAPVRAKKQLSPIIELSPRDEYFKYSTGGPFDYGGGVSSPARPVRGHKVDRIVRQLQQQQQQSTAAATELARTPSSPPDIAHAHNGNEPFSYTATSSSSPTVAAAAAATTNTNTVIVHLPDGPSPPLPSPLPPPPSQQYRSAAGMDDTWTSYDELSHRRDALESRLQRRAARPQHHRAAGSSTTVRVQSPAPSTDTYATVYKKNETLGGGDRYFERKIVTEHRFARRSPRLSGDGDDGVGAGAADDERDGASRRHKQPPRTASAMPTVVSRNNVTVVNGPTSSPQPVYAEKPAKKRSRLDRFKMLFTGGLSSSASKENKRRPSPAAAKAQYNSSDPESYTSSLRKRYNVFTGTDNNKQGNHVSGNRRMSSPSKTTKTVGNNAWFKSLDRFGKKNNNKRSKTFTSGSENDDEIRVHMVNDRNNSRGTRSYHSVGNLNSLDMDHSPPSGFTSNKRHSLIDSSAGSTTEGDSSQKSHKSTVYLHATTVGEIPESRQLHQSVFGTKSSRRAASREELSSRNDAFGGGGGGGTKRTLSRSVSVLAPWAPRQTHDGRTTVDYDERGRPPRAPTNKSTTAARHAAVKTANSDPEEAVGGGFGSRKNRASSGEESSLLDEVIIRTTSRTGKLIKDDRSTSRQIGRSMSSVAAANNNKNNSRTTGGGGTMTRIVRTKS